MIDAVSLRDAAYRLRIDAEWLTHQHDWLATQVDALPATGFHGPASTAAVARLHLLTDPFARPPEQMLRVAQVLQLTAGLREELDAAAHRMLLLAEDHARTSPVVALLLRDLAALGEALDYACARQIDLLCTPVPTEPPTRLGDTPDLSLAAVHELNQLTSGISLPPDAQLLEVGEGRMVVAVGDLTTADSVTTIVAGVGSSHPDGFDTQLERTRTIARVTGGAAVLWLGYPAPATVPAALAREPARVAGAELRAFQHELTRRFPEQRRVVVGWSYGSVVAGAASRSNGGLYADDLALIGSPGAGVDSAADLTLLGDLPQVHAMTNPSDPIALVSGVHGTDPTTPEFGARVWPGDRAGTHSSYWDDPLLLDLLRRLAKDQKKPSASSE